MSQAQRAKIQQLLSAPQSPLRDELLRLGFASLSSLPLASLTSAATLAPLVSAALTRDSATRITERHVVPGIRRVTSGFKGRPEQVRAALGMQGEQELHGIVASGKGPRFAWLKGAIDPDDFRQLLAPVVQQVLVQFTTKLPIPGLGVAGAGGGGGALGDLVGRLGRQVQKSAGQLADVGKSVMSGIGGELEKRMQSVARDFSQTATTEFRSALLDRLKSADGQVIVKRIRDRVVEHILGAKLDEVVTDFMYLPVDDIAKLTVSILDTLHDQPLLHDLLTLEIEGVLKELEQRSLADMLGEAGLLDAARTQILGAVEPGLTQLVKSDEFGGWLARVLDESSKP